MTHRSVYLLVAFALTAALLGGCQDTAPIPAVDDDTNIYPRVSLSERDLQDAIGVGPVALTKTEVGHLQVMLPIRARTRNDAHIEYRIVWKGQANQVLQPEMHWRSKRLEPKQPDHLTFMATSADAVDYNIQIRWAKH